MARFSANEVDNYGGQGGTGFFKLENDMDTAQVRLMYDSIEDVEGLSVHEVYIDGKKRYVNCLREYNEPMDNCPFCREGMFTAAKLFIPIYDVKENRVKLWERGKKFFGKISGLCSRYPHLVEHVFEIERHGKAKDTSTTYEFYPVDGEKLSFEDLPEVPDIVGGFVLDKSFDDMEYFLENNEFPPTDDGDDEEEAPVRRRSERSEGGRRSEGRTESRGRSERRTPANSGRRRSAEDEY